MCDLPPSREIAIEKVRVIKMPATNKRSRMMPERTHRAWGRYAERPLDKPFRAFGAGNDPIVAKNPTATA